MANWSQEQVEQILQGKDWLNTHREIQDGIQYILSDGTPIDWFRSSGKVVVRGRATTLQAEAKSIFSDESPQTVAAATQDTSHAVKAPPKRVFIVYGHDTDALDELELILRRLQIEPIILKNIPAAGDTLIEKLETLTEADFACVLLTPDDEGHRYEHSEKKQPRARQNVVLELGMVLAKLGRKRVAILIKGDNLEKPSDIAGLIYLPFQEHIEEVKNSLAADLEKSGFDIQLKDLI